MLFMFPNIPKRKSPIASCQAVVANPKLLKHIPYMITEKTTNLWLPYRVTNLPENGIITNCPTGSANKILPKSASLSAKVILISGIRLAQVAKHKPIAK